MSTMCSTYSTDRRYYRLSSTPRGKPTAHHAQAFDAVLPALFGLFTALTLVAYISQIVP